MSVIAKMEARERHEFGTGSLLELNCVCENDLMAAYAGSEEDRLFTRYSPWGEMKINQPAGFDITGGIERAKFYVMIVAGDEAFDPTFPDAVAYRALSVRSVTDFGDNMAKRVEMCESGPMPICDTYRPEYRGSVIERFSWKMSIDNPGATQQLKPGSPSGYWLALYPADKLDRDGAIRAAHGR